MAVRWSIGAGILSAVLLGAALLGGEGGARPGSSRGPAAALARARLHERAERERTEPLRRLAAAREEEGARWSASNAASADEIPIDDGMPEDPSRGNRGDESGAGLSDIGCTEGALVLASPPDDRGEPEPEEVQPPPPSPENWLVRHQAEDGSWDGAALSGRCTDAGCTGPGEAGHAVGDTGLALLTFLGTGETHKTPRYGKTVRSGLKHLKSIQDFEGCFGERIAEGWLEDHAIATLAMAETYGLTQSPLFKATAQNSVAFLESCRDPYLAWKYGAVPGPGDAATTAWAVMALKSAKGAGLDVDSESFEGARQWFEARTDPGSGRIFTGGEDGDASEAPTASGMLARIFCGAAEGDPLVGAGARTLLAGIPGDVEEAGEPDPLLDYLGSLAFWCRDPFHAESDDYTRWRNALAPVVRSRFEVVEPGCAAGSLEPAAGLGRLRTTALEGLAFGVLHRCGYRRVRATGAGN